MDDDEVNGSGEMDSILEALFAVTRPRIESRLRNTQQKTLERIFQSSNHREFFLNIDSSELDKDDYNLFMRFYFSGEVGISPPGAPRSILPSRENGWDVAKLRDHYGVALNNRDSGNYLEVQPELLRESWIELYTDSGTPFGGEGGELRDSIEKMVLSPPGKENQAVWVSHACLLLRKAGRHYYKQEQHDQRNSKNMYNAARNDGSIHQFQAAWLLNMFRKVERMVDSFEQQLVKEAQFLLGYERGVVLNYFGSHGRALDTLRDIEPLAAILENSSQRLAIHPVMKAPLKFHSMFHNLTKSWYGKKIDYQRVAENVSFAIVGWKSNSSDSFDRLSCAILHYYSLLTHFNDGSMELVPDDDTPWENFQSMHPFFYSRRVNSYMILSDDSSHSWSQNLRDGLMDLVEDSRDEGQGQRALDALLKNNSSKSKKNLDLSINNPLATYDGSNPSFADQINDWAAYMDMVVINQLRATQGGSHHFDHFGPLRTGHDSWSWIASSSEIQRQSSSKGRGRQPYSFEHYLAQSFRASTKPKSTKMDRINLMVTILRKLTLVLHEYVPKIGRLFVNMDAIKRLQKPILVLPGITGERGDGNDDKLLIYLPLYTHVAIDRVLTLNGLLSDVENLLELAELQTSYRKGITAILHRMKEQVGLEFIHLIVISTSSDHNNDAPFVEGAIEHIRRRVEKDWLTSEYANLLKEIKRLEERHERLVKQENTDAVVRCAEKLAQTSARREALEAALWDDYQIDAVQWRNSRAKESLAAQRARLNENELLFDDYLSFKFKQDHSPFGFASRYINDKRSVSILEALEDVPWWNYEIEHINEEKLAQTMVAWIRHRASESPIPLILPRSRGGR